MIDHSVSIHPGPFFFAYRDKLQTELDILERQQIITLVTTPTEWCTPRVVTPKNNTDWIQMCIDLSHLNHYVHQERYQSSTPAQAVADIATTNTNFHCIGCLKRLSPVPFRQRKPNSYHFHHTIWQI